MARKIMASLEEAGLTPAEYSVLFHVQDSIVEPRAVLVDWVVGHPLRLLAPNITVNDCVGAIDSLIGRGLLIELRASDIDADLARWQSERLPISRGVDRDRAIGDIDFTRIGYNAMVAINRQQYPEVQREPAAGYDDATPGLIRAFGETPAAADRMVGKLMLLLSEPQWSRAEVRAEPVKWLGPWWYSRFECIPTGFEIVLRRSVR